MSQNDTLQQNIQDILESVQFLKDNMASKEDLERFATKEDLERFATKNDLEIQLTEVKSEIMTHVDGFIALHQKLDIELTALRAKYDRLNGHIQQLAKHLQLQLN